MIVLLNELYLTHPAKILLQRLMFLRCHAVIRCLSDGRRSTWNVWTSARKLILGLSIPAVGVMHCDVEGSHSLCLSKQYVKIINDYECHSYTIDRVFPSILKRGQLQIRFKQTRFDPLWLLAINCNTTWNNIPLCECEPCGFFKYKKEYLPINTDGDAVTLEVKPSPVWEVVATGQSSACLLIVTEIQIPYSLQQCIEIFFCKLRLQILVHVWNGLFQPVFHNTSIGKVGLSSLMVWMSLCGLKHYTNLAVGFSFKFRYESNKALTLMGVWRSFRKLCLDCKDYDWFVKDIRFRH